MGNRKNSGISYTDLILLDSSIAMEDFEAEVGFSAIYYFLQTLKKKLMDIAEY